MRKIYKLGLSLGATTSIVAPITTIACDNKGSGDTHKPIVTPTPPTTPTAPVTFSKKVEEIAAQIVAKYPNVDNNEALKKLITAFIAFKPATTVTDEAKLASNLTGGNQTYDNDNDLTRANLDFNDDVKQLANSDQFDLVSGKEKVYTLQWYEGKDEIATTSASIKAKNTNDQAIFLSRKTVSPDLAVRYPVISQSNFTTVYGEFVKKTIAKLMEELGGVADMLGIAGINSWYLGAVKFLVDKFYDSNKFGVTLPADLDAKLENINQTGDVNWIAVKAMYLGFDKSFIESYPDLMNDNWVKNKDSVGLGLIDTTGKQSALGILTNIAGTSWAHTVQFNFNPTLSRDDNYKTNNKTTPTTGSNVSTTDSAFVTTEAPYSVETLMKEANAIGWSKTDKFAVWKNGLLCESNSQFINLLVHLAKEYGYAPAADEFVITDDMIK